MFYDTSVQKSVINLALQPSTAQQMKPCPFCGGKPELANTHTAAYWLECGCGLQLNDNKATGASKTMRAHRNSAKRVVDAWQRRNS